jgi:hypothetical protein
MYLSVSTIFTFLQLPAFVVFYINDAHNWETYGNSQWWLFLITTWAPFNNVNKYMYLLGLMMMMMILFVL